MFFILSKVLTFLLMPYTQMFIWVLLAIRLKKPGIKKIFWGLALFYLFFFSNRFMVNEVLLLWEVPPTPFSEIKKTYDTGIILGGTTNADKEPRDRVYIYKSAERMTHAVQLFKMGYIKTIIVSGGSSRIFNRDYNEADHMREFLLLCGIPDSVILVEKQARNTRENALFSVALITDRSPESSHLVITSAFHLRRSVQCFQKAGLEVDGFSTDFYGKRRMFTPEKLLVPDPTAFADWHMIIHEITGIIFYKIAGYI